MAESGGDYSSNCLADRLAKYSLTMRGSVEQKVVAVLEERRPVRIEFDLIRGRSQDKRDISRGFVTAMLDWVLPYGSV